MSQRSIKLIRKYNQIRHGGFVGLEIMERTYRRINWLEKTKVRINMKEKIYESEKRNNVLGQLSQSLPDGTIKTSNLSTG